MGLTRSQATKDIKAQRRASNAAFEAHDLLAFVSFFDQDYVITYGSGEKSLSLSSAISAVEAQFRDDPETVFVRTPMDILVNEAGTLAMEQGRWSGGPHGKPLHSGRYSAGWRKTPRGWKIHSELFVTLSADTS